MLGHQGVVLLMQLLKDIVDGLGVWPVARQGSSRPQETCQLLQGVDSNKELAACDGRANLPGELDPHGGHGPNGREVAPAQLVAGRQALEGRRRGFCRGRADGPAAGTVGHVAVQVQQREVVVHAEVARRGRVGVGDGGYAGAEGPEAQTGVDGADVDDFVLRWRVEGHDVEADVGEFDHAVEEAGAGLGVEGEGVLARRVGHVFFRQG